MRCVIRKLPGGRLPSEYRVMFSERSDERPLETRLVGDADKLREFLVNRLEVPPSKLGRLFGDLETTGGTGYLEMVDFTKDEVRALLKKVALEDKQQAAGNTLPATQAAQITIPAE